MKIAAWSEVAKIVSPPDYSMPTLEASDVDGVVDVPATPATGAGAPMQIIHLGPTAKPDLSPNAMPNTQTGAALEAGSGILVPPPSVSPEVTRFSGRYAIWRGTGTTGCILNLDGQTRDAIGNFRATLSPACRDQGVTGLDPTSWTIERGRLVLSSRNGGRTNFERRPDGTWEKGGGDSQSLVLTRD
jgi:hypothetical protein